MRFPWGGVEAFLVVEEGRIAGCSFRGDYFGSGEYAPLLSRLIGIPYTKESVTRAVGGFDTHALFAGSAPADLAALLTPDL
jgi:lipoate-protein ligase A